MNESKKQHIRRDRAAGMEFYAVCRKHNINRNQLREVLGMPPITREGTLAKITPEKVQSAVIAAGGSRAEAARILGVSADIVRIRIRQGRDMGLEYPEHLDAAENAKQSAERLRPGEWCEHSPSNASPTLVTVVWSSGAKSLVRLEDDTKRLVSTHSLTWVPSPDVITEHCQQIRSRWAPEEFRRRAPHAHVGEYEIPQWQTGDMSADCVW
jgi:hypothetical protein